MLGKTPGKIVVPMVVLGVVAMASISICQYARARHQIGTVSTRFVEAASNLDLEALRDCLTEDGRALLPDSYASIAARKMSELNRGVRSIVRVEVVDVKTSGTEATVRLKRSVTQRGTRLGKAVDTHHKDECTVVCVYDGKQWLVDLQRTVKSPKCPISDISLLRECLGK